MLLDLSFTQVTGDVKVFVGNQQLQILKLASAPVFLGTASGQIVLRTLCAQWTFEMFFEHVLANFHDNSILFADVICDSIIFLFFGVNALRCVGRSNSTPGLGPPVAVVVPR